MVQGAYALKLTATDDPLERPVVIVGSGPVGMRTAQELLQRDPDLPLVIYGNERWEPYNRVRLSCLLAGDVDWSALATPLRTSARSNIVCHHNCEVVSIDRRARTITDAQGRIQRYAKLVLATGSRPRMPNIFNIDLPEVFTFREMDDVERLLARRARTRRTVVLGGGLLGLEAARGMQRCHTDVLVIEPTDRLMSRQLDERAAALVRERIMDLGIEIALKDGVRQILGETKVTGVELRSGRMVPCDTIVVATGIRPNIALARDAGLSVGRAIRVDDAMRSSDPHIYAVGECAEHRGQVYGLVAPGLEQAAVAAHSFTGRKARYTGSISAARLKVAGCDVFSMGRVGEEESPNFGRTILYERPNQQLYRRLVTHRGRLVGAIAVGPWSDLGRIREGIQSERWIWPWQLRRFARSGSLWRPEGLRNVSRWPANATVCNCMGITRGTLSEALAGGACSVEGLAARTGASSVCGSCRPLLAELVGTPGSFKPVRGFRTLLVSGALGLLALLLWCC